MKEKTIKTFEMTANNLMKKYVNNTFFFLISST